MYIKLCIHNNIYVPWIYNNIYNLYKSISRSTLRENFRQGTKEKRRKEKKKRWSSYTRKRVVQQGRSVTIDYLCRWRRPATVKLKAGIEGLLHVGRYTRFRILSFHGAKWAVIVRNVGDIFYCAQFDRKSKGFIPHGDIFDWKEYIGCIRLWCYINWNMEKKNIIFSKFE